MKKTTTKAMIAPAQAPVPAAVVPVSPPEQIDCRIWRAWRGIGYHERSVIDGLLLTEPNNLDAPIAYLKIGGELGLGSMEKALRRAAQIFQNTAHIDRDDTPMDLRTLCRWWSTEATPARLYDIQVMLETAIELGTRAGGESGTTSFQRIAPFGAGSNTFSLESQIMT